MRTDVIFVFGAGGHSKVVIDAMLKNGIPRQTISVVDSDPLKRGTSILDFPIETAPDVVSSGSRFHVAVGACEARERIYRGLIAAGSSPVVVIHPQATISPFSTVGAASFVAAQAVIGPAAAVGSGAIINHGVIVDHDCVVGDFSHIAPNATLGGAVRIGARTLVGAGSTVLPGVNIGDDSIIGAGAVVLRDVGSGETYVGVPATKVTRS